jgi:hypothetical protein
MQFLCHKQFWMTASVNKDMKTFDSGMPQRFFSKWIRILVSACLVWLAWSTASCSLLDNSIYDDNPRYSLDPIFHIFYRNLGGQNVMGQAISPLMENGEQKVQFVEKGMFVFAPSASEIGMVRLWPVGRELQIEEPPIDVPLNMQDGALFLNGHYVPPDFAQFITKIGGLTVVGDPLTEVRFNPLYQRYEQFFENVGLYHLRNSDKNDIRLLSYGSWMCAETCATGKDGAAILDIARPVSEPFFSQVNRLGRDFTGYPLVYEVGENETPSSEFRVFKNLVMIQDSLDPTQVRLLPIPELIGIEKEQPVVEQSADRAVFIPTSQDGRGYNVPDPLFEYINRHGGLSITGLPITHFQKYGEGFRQCFEYVCLIHQPQEVEWLQTQPEALGYFYIRLHPESRNESLAESGDVNRGDSSSNVTDFILETWEEYPYLSPGFAQTIHIMVKDQLNNRITGFNADLVVKVPENNRNIHLTFPPTDSTGQAQIEVPILVLPNGTLIPYEVCIEDTEGKLCEEDEYVIWESP